MKPRGCWYCEGTVTFDSDGIGDCDSCPETYSAREFIERENEHRKQRLEAADVEYQKQMLKLTEETLGIDLDPPQI